MRQSNKEKTFGGERCLYDLKCDVSQLPAHIRPPSTPHFKHDQWITENKMLHEKEKLLIPEIKNNLSTFVSTFIFLCNSKLDKMVFIIRVSMESANYFTQFIVNSLHLLVTQLHKSPQSQYGDTFTGQLFCYHS